MPNSQLPVYLFDMDAVLLYPGGYRAALTATVNFFSRELGLGDQAPTEHEIEVFESVGITNEWDSVPICLVALTLEGTQRNYEAIARYVGAETQRGEFPAEAASRLFAAQLTGKDEIKNFLQYSRDIHRSRVLQIFQQYTLGDEYQATYGLPRTFPNGHGSVLLTHDRKAITQPVPPRSVIYTARPSGPPRDAPPQLGYPPEAELGARLVGLSHLPLIGFGRLQWLAQEVGGREDGYLKPSPVHGVAAIAAAAGMPESAALLGAAALARGEVVKEFESLRGVRVTVFEDSANSIQGVREAAKLIGGTCVGIGISNGGPKRDRLEKIADRVYPSVDEAILGEING